MTKPPAEPFNAHSLRDKIDDAKKSLDERINTLTENCVNKEDLKDTMLLKNMLSGVAVQLLASYVLHIGYLHQLLLKAKIVYF